MHLNPSSASPTSEEEEEESPLTTSEEASPSTPGKTNSNYVLSSPVVGGMKIKLSRVKSKSSPVLDEVLASGRRRTRERGGSSSRSSSNSSSVNGGSGRRRCSKRRKIVEEEEEEQENESEVSFKSDASGHSAGHSGHKRALDFVEDRVEEILEDDESQPRKKRVKLLLISGREDNRNVTEVTHMEQ